MATREKTKNVIQVLSAQDQGYGARSMAIEPFSPGEMDRAARVAAQMHAAWGGWLGSFPVNLRSASGLSRGLGVDRTTCQRLVHAVRGGFGGPVLLSRVPGVSGLRSLLEAGSDRVPEGVHEAAARALAAFASAIDDLGGSQSRLIRRLDASKAESVPGFVPTEDEEAERRRLLDASARVTGRCSDLWMAVYLFQSDATRERMRVSRVYGLLGHRATPDAVPLVIQNFGVGPLRETGGEAPGARAFDAAAAGLVELFSTDTSVLARDTRGGGLLAQRVDTEGGGIVEPIDLVFSATGDSPHPRLSDPAVANLWAMIHFPARAMLLDAYMPVSEARSSLPSVGVHLLGQDTDLGARPGWTTRFPSSPRLEILGRGLEGAHSPLHRRHRELTRMAFERAGADPDDFVGYRVAVPFPIWRAAYCLSFDFESPGRAAGEPAR